MDDNELRYIREHGIRPEDEAAFRRMDKYYYFLDAFMWCEDNGYGCDYSDGSHHCHHLYLWSLHLRRQ